MLAADPRGASIAASADNASSRAWGWYRGAPQAVPRRYLQLIRKVRFWPIADVLAARSDVRFQG
jgi:hypothetical protein